MRLIVSIIVLLLIGGAIWFVAGSPGTEPEGSGDTTKTGAENEIHSHDDEDDDRVHEHEEESEHGTDIGAEFPIIEEGMGTAEESPVIVVTYTDSGFSPSTVTISAGDTVRFVNQSSRGMWVGSDNHPTHTLYPESTSDDCLGSAFDQCESSGSGTSWEFTFNTTGSWGYHNHVRASHSGTVVVQ